MLMCMARVRVDAVPVGGPVYLTVEASPGQCRQRVLARVLVYPDRSVTVSVSRAWLAASETVIGSAGEGCRG